MADKEKKSNKFALIGKKIAKFFIELKAELKKVVWPDRKKLTQSTITVVMICLFAAIFIFSVDKILSGFLGAVGFFPGSSATSTTTSSIVLSNPAASGSTSSSSGVVSSMAGSSTVSAK